MQNNLEQETNKKLDWLWLRNLIKLVEDTKTLAALKNTIKSSFINYKAIEDIELVISEIQEDNEDFEEEINNFILKHELTHINLDELIIKRIPCEISSREYIFPLESANRLLGLMKIKYHTKFDQALINLIWSFSDAVSERIHSIFVSNLGLKANIKSTSFNIFNNMKGFLEASLERLKAVEEQNQQLIKANEQRTELINNVSHELRTPLVSIMGFSKLLQRREIETNLVLEASEQIQSAGSRLSRMIDDLIQLNRASTQGWQLNVERLDIGEIGRIVVESLVPLYKNHNFTFDYLEKYPMVEGDRKLLRQVIENLLLNAIKYSPDGGNINLALSNNEEENLLALAIQDEGIGMTKEEQARIFDRFYRAKNKETENIAGLGLGLSICKDVVEALNGSISCESEYQKGSCFIIKMRY